MANTLDKSNIINGNTILPGHVTQSIDALTGTQAYDITISGSLTLTGSVSSQNGFIGDLVGTASLASVAVNANNATTSSYALTATSSSYTLSGSYSATAVSASYSATAVSASYATTGSYAISALSASYALSASRVVEASITTQVRPSNTVSDFGYTLPYLSGTGSLATMYYSATGPTYNPTTETITSTNFEGTASYASTASIVQNYVDGTRNFTTISPRGTIYTKYEDVFMSQSAVAEYDLLAAVTTFTGDRTIPNQYVQANTSGEAKVVKFHINGFIKDPNGGTPNIDSYVKIGDTPLLNGTQIGAVDLINNSEGPFEIDGELIFTNGQVRACIGLGYCNDNNQVFYKYPLSNLYSPDAPPGIGGALKFVVSGSSQLEITASYARIEFIN